MRRYSFVLVDTPGAFTETFGSRCHVDVVDAAGIRRKVVKLTPIAVVIG